MNEILEIIKNNPLFKGINHDDLQSLLKCLNARKESFKKDEIIFLAGDDISFVGLVLRGSVKIIKEDQNGNITILTEIKESEVFGETFACAEIDKIPVTVKASKNCELLFMDYAKIINFCTSVCPFHAKLIENMMRLVARKNIMLNKKIQILSKRTIREKILCFLDIQRSKNKRFSISYNREEMAHYLCVDRSAMSKELCKMRDEGIIRFNKNDFELLIEDNFSAEEN